MALSTDTPTTPASGAFRWRRQDTVRTAGLMAVIAGLHVVAFGVLFLLVVPHHYTVGSRVFGVGLGITAYTLGMRHAFDADHIAAIDNTTRKLMADGKRPVSVGFWFALGHSSVVVVMAALVAGGAQLAGILLNDESRMHQILGMVGTTVSGSFLYLIAALNLIALSGMWRVFREMRSGRYDEAELERQLDSRGFMNRFLGRFTRSVSRPGQMFPLGFLFGLGFDTATEVTLMVMAGSGAAAGLPWYAVLCLPLLFAAGMSLFDTLDGTFMNFAYQWAFSNPVRKVYYNLAITGLSIAVAFFIGTIELVTVLHDKLALTDPLTGWISGLDLDNVGFIIVGLFVVVWAAALSYWRLSGVEKRWTERAGRAQPAEPEGTAGPAGPAGTAGPEEEAQPAGRSGQEERAASDA
ncbi:HoxN/HupN/NixA family nickel/cobalt transporter [Streptomyces sp. ISID311]|uniref:HoxN/HupN/NixA family nickel/cobalt transporter n=1 Tax=Streptomyces sp. ISID311 TaxID=2601673 RepID=UPI0021C2C471|nr:HoxN/HupN/NixA family nickel/cobalt transporter [Streptomyces sp. ISID311]